MKKWIAFDAGDVENIEKPSKTKKTKKDRTSNDKPPEFSSAFNDFNFEKCIKPSKKEDLAVHSKKIQEIETWLNTFVLSERVRDNVAMLVLCGPTGSGKTTTIRVLCKGLGIEVSEWVNPVDQNYDEFRGPGQTGRLLEFLNESKYPSLVSTAKTSRKVVLIEDFPNSTIHNPKEFHGILEKCLEQHGYSIVFICTDAGSQNLNLAQTLFSDEIRETYKIDKISFNACPPTILKTALKRVQSIMQKHDEEFKVPSSTIIDAIVASSTGDIRSATNQYYFACLKGISEIPTIQEVLDQSTKGTKRKRAGQTISKIKNMGRDETLGLFHSIGRVLNPKRKQVADGWRINCDLDSLIDEFATQPMSIGGFLHENYLKYFGDVDDVCNAANILSEAQVLVEKFNSDRHETVLFSLWMSVLGLMVYNEHRTTGFNPIKGPAKIKKQAETKLEDRSLDVIDRYYYNVITKSEKYHIFNC